MLFLNKLLPIFVLPLGWVVLLLIFALIRRKWWPVVVALAVLYLASLPCTGRALLGFLESRYPSLAVADVEKADAIVPLGGIFGAPVSEGHLPNMAGSGARLEAGIVLWQQHKADWLVFTGGRIPWEHQDEVEGNLAKRAAAARGVPPQQIVVTREVGNTADEARAVADLMKERGWEKIILVTSAWHMPRAARLFRKAGVNFTPFPVDFRHDEHGHLTLLDFLPSAGALGDTELALRECYGIAFYAATGR
jgi:uncharacterized SAM-binding protein YcdF (DUF218 family)